ncbi:unnamed protein product [Cuscuta campestris]|uniref:Uncharacterized protein n=1 Tax=Cuscuta campestris TaxID=132261 RepID=A0A484N595_9ASTE|nr:unnamed protein product [Cuscuta campestris]
MDDDNSSRGDRRMSQLKTKKDGRKAASAYRRNAKRQERTGTPNRQPARSTPPSPDAESPTCTAPSSRGCLFQPLNGLVV